jgi:hypothetical protein
MALSIDLQNSHFGIAFNNAYYRIVTTAITRQRTSGESKFSVMIDIAGYGTQEPSDDTREVDFRRYHTPIETIESQQGNTFLDKCYAWVMDQSDMNGSVAI